MLKQAQNFEYLESIAEIIPNQFYWMDLNYRYVGVNNFYINAVGAPDKNYIIGKTVHELYQNQEIADMLQQDIESVMKTGKISQKEDKIIDINTGKVRYCITTRSPLRDSNGKIIGLISSSIENTQAKEAQQIAESQWIFNSLNAVADLIPAAFGWSDLDGKFIGVNNLGVVATGAPNKDYIIGKNVYELYQNQRIAGKIQQDIYDVIRTGKMSQKEDEIVDINTGKTHYYMATRAPIRDSTNQIIGVIGTSIDITAEKELENLRIENEKYKIKTEEHQQIMKFLENMLHNFQSFKMEILNKKIGAKIKLPSLGAEIKLTKREREILYFLSLNKSPKEIANILSIIENKSLSPLTISSIIDKQLYIKFEVNSVSKLVEVANKLKLIPFSIA